MFERIPHTKRATMATDKVYDTNDLVTAPRTCNITPHIAAKSQGSALDRRTTRHVGYDISLRIRKRIEKIFG
jgi:hypothetical protein